MSTITKEQLRERARAKVKSLEFSITQTAFADSRSELEEELELARIALASLEAEPYGYVHKAAYEQAGSCGLSSDHEAYRDSSTHIPVYTAPPAPVSVPDLKPVGFLFVSDDGSVAYSPADWPMKGFNLIGQIYGDLNACRAAMLQGADGNSPVIPDEVLSVVRKVARIRSDFNDFDGDRRGIGDCLDEAEQELIVAINKHASAIAAAPQQEVNNDQ